MAMLAMILVMISPTRCVQRRLWILSESIAFFRSEPCGPLVRSLLCYANTHIYLRVDISLIARHFKLLNVLDLIRINIGSLCGIEEMVYLRYLAVRGNFNSIPLQIANLWNLEALIVKGTRGEIEIPDAILNLEKLRILLVKDRATFSSSWYNEKILNKYPVFDNLQAISTPCLSDTGEEKIMRRLPCLRKLSCIFTQSRFIGQSHLFPVLDFLSQLHTLKVSYIGKLLYPCEFKFPLNLRKLTLSKFCLPWKEMSTIGRLPNLEVLKVQFRAFEGQQWDTNDGEFLKLKFLKLGTLNIVQWNASSHHFPSLQQLVLQRCKRLEGIPSCLGEIPTLLAIEINWCSPFAVSSAKEISEYQQELGNEDFKISIYPPDMERTP